MSYMSIAVAHLLWHVRWVTFRVKSFYVVGDQMSAEVCWPCSTTASSTKNKGPDRVSDTRYMRAVYSRTARGASNESSSRRYSQVLIGKGVLYCYPGRRKPA
jgi:hypothetical protein